LRSKALLEDSYYDVASEIIIQEIIVYGIEERPIKVLDIHQKKIQEDVRNTKVRETIQIPAEHIYDSSNKSISVKKLAIPIDLGDSASEDNLLGKSLISIDF
jgi:hypothetical protein